MLKKNLLICPSCSAPVLQREQRQMNSFWGFRPVPCSGCSVLLQYHSSLLPRLRLGGHLFRFGLLIIAIWLALKALGILPTGILTIISWIGFCAVLTGILVTATRPSSIRFEVVGGT